MTPCYSGANCASAITHSTTTLFRSAPTPVAVGYTSYSTTTSTSSYLVLDQEVRNESRGSAENAEADRGSGTGNNRRVRGRVAASTANRSGGASHTAGSEASSPRGTSTSSGSQTGGQRGAVLPGAGVVLTRADSKVARAELLATAAGDTLAPGGLAVVAVGGSRRGAGGSGTGRRGRYGSAVVARAGVVLAGAGGQIAPAELLALAASHAGLVGRLALVAAASGGGGRGGSSRGGDGGAVVAGPGVVLACAGREVTAAEVLALAAGDARLVGGLAVVRVVVAALGEAHLGECGSDAGRDLGCAAGLVARDL